MSIDTVWFPLPVIIVASPLITVQFILLFPLLVFTENGIPKLASHSKLGPTISEMLGRIVMIPFEVIVNWELGHEAEVATIVISLSHFL